MAPTSKTVMVPTPEVKAVAKLLEGKNVLLIGGNQRDKAREALKKALRLKDVIWISTNKHDSVNDFEPYVAQSDVALVLLPIRWASHSFGKLQQTCNRYNKPLVRLPAGYAPNQVALQIMTQCGDRLNRKSSIVAGGGRMPTVK